MWCTPSACSAFSPSRDPEGKLANFHALEALSPAIVVPGHGAATDLATARRDTGDYLEMLVGEVRAGLENWETLDENVERLADLPQFQHLLHYDAWHRANVKPDLSDHGGQVTATNPLCRSWVRRGQPCGPGRRRGSPVPPG
jgi:hypothetical protein